MKIGWNAETFTRTHVQTFALSIHIARRIGTGSEERRGLKMNEDQTKWRISSEFSVWHRMTNALKLKQLKWQTDTRAQRYLQTAANTNWARL